ncbi:PKD domain-containing protein [Crocinitomix catalasitica]|uniref:PKD domain-containing protein n=1 Tax=Crocinitomix catalasitica TaxID=184607 RepID=UPI000B06CE74|nr:PKD domain-containing protein [Crocinitomix catalasitica]
MKNITSIYLVFFALISFAQTPDPGLPGDLDVSYLEYDFGDEEFDAPSFPDLIEVTGSVHYPTDMSEGPYPVILILHGRHSTCYSGGSTNISWPCTGGFEPIPSYQGYDYLGEHFASHGYIVISVSANSISSTDNGVGDRGMRARGELLQYHLDLWDEWNTVGGDPFDELFVDKLDMDNIGTMGHSRGGEGVIEHALYNRELGSPYGIHAVLTLAPVDFNRPVLNGIALMNIAPYCDGDVSDLQGVHFYDDARYNDPDDTTAKHNILMLGANHNYFNTVWTPGLFPAGAADDWGYVDGGQSDAHCGSSSPDNRRYTPEVQRNALLAYSSAFYRVYIGGEDEFDPILKVEDVVPPVSSTLSGDDIYMSFHPPMQKRVDLNRLDTEETEDINSLGAAASESGLVTYDICGDDFGEQYCIGVGTAQEPHNKNGGVVTLGLSQIEMAWNSPDDFYQNDLPVYMQDLSQFDAIQFRTSVNFQSSPFEVPLNFSVVLQDLDGVTYDLAVEDYSDALFFPPGDYGTTLPRIMHNTISLPLADFEDVDITRVESVKFLFDKSASGAVLVSDLIFSAGENVLFPPIAGFIANVTSTCTGIVEFTDLSDFSPAEWLWEFGDGTTSAEENPTHIYELSGTYTVTLTVSNEAGDDSEIIVSYIVVDKPEAPVGEDVSICGPGLVTMNVTGTGGDLEWFNDEVGGSPIFTGDEYLIPIMDTRDFYVQQTFVSPLQSVGPEDNTFGGGGFFTANDTRGLFFDAVAPFVLESVRVYAGSAGNRTIQVLDSEGGAVVHSTVVNIPAGESRIDLNFDILPHDGYYLKVTGALVDLFRINDGSPSYPYEIPGLVALTGSNVEGEELDFYYYFFDWDIREANCESSRILITAEVVTLDTLIALATDSVVCLGETTVLYGEGADTYSWDMEVEDGLSYTPTATRTYTLTGTVDECSETRTIEIVVNPLPIVTISDDVVILTGESTTLMASGGLTYAWSPIIGLDDPTSASPIASPEETTTYTVTVMDENDCQETASVTVTVENPSGVGLETLTDAQFIIRPNPSTGRIIIVHPDNFTNGSIYVYSMDGKLILTESVREANTELNLTSIARGTYYVQLRNETVIYQSKIVLQ